VDKLQIHGGIALEGEIHALALKVYTPEEFLDQGTGRPRG